MPSGFSQSNELLLLIYKKVLETIPDREKIPVYVFRNKLMNLRFKASDGVDPRYFTIRISRRDANILIDIMTEYGLIRRNHQWILLQ